MRGPLYVNDAGSGDGIARFTRKPAILAHEGYVGAQKRAYQREWKKRRWAEWIESNGPCVACGSAVDLEVDHIDPSKKIDHKVWSWSAVRRNAELAKCQVLCRTCHVAKTNAQTYRAVQHGTSNMYRLGCRCDDCKAIQRVRVAAWRVARRLVTGAGIGPATSRL